MTEYRFHWQLIRTETPTITLEAETHLHGAALALRYFKQVGCDIAGPLAHIDTTEPDGLRHTVLVQEVLDWLKGAGQADFMKREGLASLFC
jgi:hypothetical protein